MATESEAPIGRHLHWVARIVQKAFNDALTEAGGSQPTWLILLMAKREAFHTQQELAQAVGIEGPTLTYHLDALEAQRLITRTREPADRRAIQVSLTPAGEALFDRLFEAAAAFDRRLRRGVSEGEIATVRATLTRFAENAREQ
ncbi:MAG TPA: MarR family transcriptional regulator [Acidimicrobiia bacterium]